MCSTRPATSPVVFRTVDIGGDKVLPYLRHNDGELEENPAMGWRALRVALEREGLLKVQARALLEAAAGRTLNVMFPMVSEPWEFDAAKAVFEGQLPSSRARKSCCPKRSAMARCWKFRRWPNSLT
jgi:phosphotransferase system enzyme I (PtsP)